MTRSEQTDKQTNSQWHARFAKERLNLSASVEEELAERSLDKDPLSDDPDSTPDEIDELASGSHRTVIIPPRLSLQSREMPAVRSESAGTMPSAKVVATPDPTTRPAATPGRVQKKQRLGGRTTKVRLQAVPKSDKKLSAGTCPEKIDLDHGQEPVAEQQMLTVTDGSREFASAGDTVAEKPPVSNTNTRGKLSGSSIFECGQEEATVPNGLISSSSVVIVTLIGDPGPVVVHYVSLQPQIGFTVHLSAPATKQTAFNYVILMTELF